MKIGMITDSLAGLPLEKLLAVAAELGLERLEFACGNWSPAPHLKLERMLEDQAARREFSARLAGHGLAVSALNCSGNPLHPGEHGRQHREVTRKTIELASRMEVGRVVMMSGCPGGPGDANANWVTTSWPPEMQTILAYQWEEVLIPYWRELARFAAERGVSKLCLELHGHQNVYSVATFRRLREAVGDVVGVNFDPSHLMWMGADPLAAVAALGSAIYHVHAKDTEIDRRHCGLNGRIETTPSAMAEERAWNYVTLGRGHDLAWWRAFCAALRAAGYDDVLSIEHEDVRLDPLEGVRQTVGILRAAIAG